jgi:hypothetical protein
VIADCGQLPEVANDSFRKFLQMMKWRSEVVRVIISDLRAHGLEFSSVLFDIFCQMPVFAIYRIQTNVFKGESQPFYHCATQNPIDYPPATELTIKTYAIYT